jgi:helicase, putative, recD/traA family
MIEDILNKLNSSKFRSSFHLKSGDVNYIKEKGLSKIESHALDFINKRLKDVSKVNDGKQTPIKGHPVFIAQHATATCCRGCLEKWHKIEKTHILNEKEVLYIKNVIMKWIERELKS